MDLHAPADRRTLVGNLSEVATRRLAALWGQVDRAAIAASWSEMLSEATATVSLAQMAAARTADAYIDTAWAELGHPAATAEGRVAARSLAGIASDGRSLASLLQQPAIRALTTIGAGGTPADGMATGLAQLGLIGTTQVADAARAAEQVSMVARPAIDGYVRVLSPPSCGRCAVQAGRWFRVKVAFRRHPGCDCTTQPADEVDGLTTDVGAYFDSLDPRAQNRYFGAAASEQIRDGGDIAAAVNAQRRRGLAPAAPIPAARPSGGKSWLARADVAPGALTPERLAFLDRELALYRHQDQAGTITDWGRTHLAAMESERATAVRVMPGHLIESADSRAGAIAALKAAGYLTT